jgi:hypothetical protein
MGHHVCQNDATLLPLKAQVDDWSWSLRLLGPAYEVKGQEGKSQKHMVADLARLACGTVIMGRQIAGQEYVGWWSLRS